jgi:uncharacterized RDD family membrane protein YckC
MRINSGVKAEFTPSFLRRLAAMVYDSFLLVALWFLATALLLPLNGGQAFDSEQIFYPVYLLCVSFGFYGWFWTHGGQTLGLKAWKIKVLTLEQQPLNWHQAAIRFVVAMVSWAIGGLGFLWSLWDKNGCAWHDYVSKTRLFFESEESVIQTTEVK